MPSTLLERRPDIAQAERTMQQENALIGVAEAAFFPDISLSGVLEWIGKNPLPFSVANEVWSLGAAASEPIFDGGLHAAQLDAARAAYWQSVATYRQTVLTAFQGVEDQLAAIRLLVATARGRGEPARQKRPHRGQRVFQPVPGRHDRVHHGGDRRSDAAGRRGSPH